IGSASCGEFEQPLGYALGPVERHGSEALRASAPRTDWVDARDERCTCDQRGLDESQADRAESPDRDRLTPGDGGPLHGPGRGADHVGDHAGALVVQPIGDSAALARRAADILGESLGDDRHPRTKGLATRSAVLTFAAAGDWVDPHGLAESIRVD